MLDATIDLCKLLGDPTRLRLLSVLSAYSLTVAELVEIMGLSQSRISTHLGKLREAGLVYTRPEGARTLYSLDPQRMPEAAARWWRFTAEDLTDPILAADRQQAAALIAGRHGKGWADSVAGRMARHYSPGRTWPAFARGLAALIGLPGSGRLLDIASGDGALAELVAPQIAEVICLDQNEAVIAEGRRRLAHLPNLTMTQGDMHALPFEAASFHGAVLMGALCYAAEPAQVIAEAARILRPGGRLVVVTLAAHDHRAAVAPYDHVQLGFRPDDLRQMMAQADLSVARCEITQREKRPPHFEVITATALRRPS